MEGTYENQLQSLWKLQSAWHVYSSSADSDLTKKLSEQMPYSKQ